MDIIYCAGGNQKLASIAIEEGFLYGSRSDDIRGIHCDGLIDINWKKYDWSIHLEQVKKHHPKYAVVPDVTNLEMIDNTITYIEEVKNFCNNVIVVPKAKGIIARIPRNVIIGVSVPTSYAGFIPELSELKNRKVHLLGGTPRQQRELWKYYQIMGIAVTSVDCNCHSKTSDYGKYWNGNKWCLVDSKEFGKYQTFRLSCKGIINMWQTLNAK